MIPTLQLGQFGRAQARAANNNDPYFANVVLLVDASSQTDNSTPSGIDVIGKTPTYRNNARCKTDQYKFGTSSMYFDGTNDRISFADSADFNFGTGDFTVECFARPSDTGTRELLSQANSYGGHYSVRMTRSGATAYATFLMSDGSSPVNASSATNTFPQDTWSHLAISRVGNNFYRCLNGAAATFRTTAYTPIDSTGAFCLGAYFDSDTGSQWAGWIDQVRVTKGVGRYSGAYTVPTAKFPHS
jgi:hypothetical protein